MARSARRRRLALCVAACAPPPPPRCGRTARRRRTFTDALLFGDHWAARDRRGLSWAQELSLQLGVPAERTVDCGAAGAPSRALAARLKRCARARSVAIGNGTVVVIHAGGDDDKDDGRGGVDGGHLRALLLRGRAPPLEAYERVPTSPPPSATRSAARARSSSGRCPSRAARRLRAAAARPVLHERLPRAVDAAARAAAGALHRLVPRARGKPRRRRATPLVLFSEALAVGGGGGGRSANWRIACEHAAACEARCVPRDAASTAPPSAPPPSPAAAPSPR